MTNKEAKRILQFCMPMNTKEKREALDLAIKALENERPHGNWIKVTSGNYIYFRCNNPNCNNFVSNPTRFCSNCGACMIKEANNETN